MNENKLEKYKEEMVKIKEKIDKEETFYLGFKKYKFEVFDILDKAIEEEVAMELKKINNRG